MSGLDVGQRDVVAVERVAVAARVVEALASVAPTLTPSSVVCPSMSRGGAPSGIGASVAAAVSNVRAETFPGGTRL